MREDYGPAAMADPFAQAISLFTSLLQEFSGPTTGHLPHHELEERAAAGGRELARRLLQGHLDQRAAQEHATLSTLTPAERAQFAQGRSRCEASHDRALSTVVGPVTVSRCALRAPGMNSIHPADTALALPRERHSFGVRRLGVLEAVRGSYDSALAAIERVVGTRAVGKRQLEQLVIAAAVDVTSFYTSRVPTPEPASTLLVISVDGKGIVMRPEHLREATARAARRAQRTFRTRLAAGEKANRKRMATLACVYHTDPAPRRPHDVIAPPGGRTHTRTLRPGPIARAKWLTASIAHEPEQVIARAFDQAQARDPQHRRAWIVLVDGAVHQLNLIQAEAARRDVDIHIVLDIVHVLERLWAAARCFHPPTDPAAEDWIALKAARILTGDAAGCARDLRAEADHMGAADRTGVDKAADYLEKYRDFLHYDQALTRGWPIGSGSIEGAARHLVADRLDITGSRWNVPGAEALLQLRAVLKNGDFDAYWRHHVTAETRRVHPHADQRIYHLTV